MKKNYHVLTVSAYYNGGGTWVYYGATTDGEYFLTDDNGTTFILESDPVNIEKSLDSDWIFQNMITDLSGSMHEKFYSETVEKSILKM